MIPVEPLKIVDKCLRSTIYISKHGTMYRNYHDTGKWQIVPPRFDNEGRVCGYKNKCLQRLIAEAWLESPDVTTDGNRMPNVKVIDETQNPYDADNLTWCYGRRCKNTEILKHLPPKLEYLQDLLEEENMETMEDVSDELNVSLSTAWNYVCKLISQNPDPELAQKIAVFINSSCLEICLDYKLQGTLSDAMVHINEKLFYDDEWNRESEKYSHLRLARMYCDILEGS